MNSDPHQGNASSKRKRVMSIEGILSVVTDKMIKENKKQLRKLRKNSKYFKEINQSDSSFEIIRKKSPQKINKKIKLTKSQLHNFIQKNFIVVSDEERCNFKVEENRNSESKQQKEIIQIDDSKQSPISFTSSEYKQPLIDIKRQEQ